MLRMSQSPVGRAAAAPDAVVAARPDLSIGPAPFAPAGAVVTLRPSRRGVALRRLLRTPSACLGLLVVLLWIACAIFWPLIAPYNPNAQDYTALLAGPSPAHLLGTDQFGRDVLSRVLAGSREVLVLAPAATLLGLLGGVGVGLATAFYRGWLDEVVMRVMDAIMAFPIIVLSLLVLAVLGASRLNVILVIAFTYVPLTGRVVRAAALTVRDLDYVAAARLRGANGFAIMLTEILPNISGPIIVEGTVRVGYAVFAAASLSFIGLGVPPPSPDWGAMINDTHIYVQNDPVIVLAPTLAIASLVVAINLVADGLRQAVRA
jgi:peptide/nickel transport system permease protein